MPRVGLTRERVVATAADIADGVGLDHLTLAAVAERSNVALPSLYKHVRGLDDLRRELALLGTRELAAALAEAADGRRGEAALAELCAAYRDYARRRPGPYLAAMKAPDPDDAEHEAAVHELLAPVGQVLADVGLERDAAVHATRYLHAVLHGFVVLEPMSFEMPQSVEESFRLVVEAVGTSLRTWPQD